MSVRTDEKRNEEPGGGLRIGKKRRISVRTNEKEMKYQVAALGSARKSKKNNSVRVSFVPAADARLVRRLP